MENVKEYLEPVSKVALDVKEQVRQPSQAFVPPLFSHLQTYDSSTGGFGVSSPVLREASLFPSRGDVVEASLGQRYPALLAKYSACSARRWTFFALLLLMCLQCCITLAVWPAPSVLTRAWRRGMCDFCSLVVFFVLRVSRVFFFCFSSRVRLCIWR